MTKTHTTYRVLLIDDEQSSYTFIRDLLSMPEQHEYLLDWQPEYNRALDALLHGGYDACLMDYNLGDQTGLELIQATEGKRVRTAIIMLTGQGTHTIDMQALQAGAVEFLDKTRLRPVLLTRTIRYAVKQQQDRNALTDLYNQVRELEQLKTDMIRIAAHDLRTPLMTMLNYANFLRDDTENPLTDYQQDYVSEITDSVNRMQTIISDILSLERIQETAEDRYLQTTDLVQAVRTVTQAIMPPLRELSFDINTPDTPITVKGDAAQLREAATNLISNAIKYTPDGGTITVSLVVEGDEAVFTVADTGYGIRQEQQERLFQPFYRAKSKETRQIAGSGLGLHLVRNIIKRHHGEVFFSSVYGEGSTFGFRLPLYTED